MFGMYFETIQSGTERTVSTKNHLIYSSFKCVTILCFLRKRDEEHAKKGRVTKRVKWECFPQTMSKNLNVQTKRLKRQSEYEEDSNHKRNKKRSKQSFWDSPGREFTKIHDCVKYANYDLSELCSYIKKVHRIVFSSKRRLSNNTMRDQFHTLRSDPECTWSKRFQELQFECRGLNRDEFNVLSCAALCCPAALMPRHRQAAGQHR